jgi:pectinesterase
MKRKLVICLSLLLSAAAAAQATTRHVRPDGTGEYATIQAAISASTAGDVVELLEGTYTGTGNKNISFLGKAITVRSAAGDPRFCIVDCQDNGYGFAFTSGETANSILRGITVANGYTTSGAGLYFSGASPRIEDCIFRNNRANFGGAMYT